ncbi:beta-propeller fold lactonase family protein [Primorskyibacter aestuariivivens]|uniref:calcium-binding protein n=1 Tax=Primorskyibacter aestuariivivens TaxID=1888912 RepID=UPI0023004724|nr:beta-propeller fold lactonase family protein [Primorskyibacter aestuariivivens]MDA7429601.1 beta-propeller fold lactonase family protein [Primorskyibacter aestuariivivens]
MQILSNGHVATGDIALDGDIRDLEIITLPGGGVQLFAATGAHGGITSWRIDGVDLPVETDRAYFPGWISQAVDGLASWLTVGGTNQIVIGGEAGTDLLCYALDANGQITTLETATGLRSGTDRVVATIDVSIGGTDFVYLADQGTGELSGYSTNAAGDLVFIGASAQIDVGPSVDLETVHLGGQAYLLVADDSSQGITSYRIDATSGALTQTDQQGAASGLGIATPTAMEVIEAFGHSFVLLGAAGSSSLSVMRLTSGGALEPTDHVIDGLATRFGGVTAMGVAQHDNRAFVVVGGADDGLSLFTLLPDGRLLHLDTVAHSSGSGLMNITDIAATVIGDEMRIYVTSGTEHGIHHLSIDLSALTALQSGTGLLSGGTGDDLLQAASGNTTLSGGAGDDILIAEHAGVTLQGGIGQDRFVLSVAQGTYHLLDFRPGEDVLDLSDFPMLRSVGQLGFTTTANGARLSFGDTVVDVTAANGAPLTLADLFGTGPGFTWADRVPLGPITVPPPPPPLPPSGGGVISGTAGNDLIIGSATDDVMSGGSGADTLAGAEGDDQLWGGDGFDLLRGELGNDLLGGGNGNDMLIGGDGNDMLGGGSGHDTLWGGLGGDTLEGGTGNDVLGGGAGGDVISGGGGADSLGGAGGHDQIWGGADDDLLRGGLGNDTLGAGDGNDTMTSGVGHDVLGAGAGHDVIWSGTGNDTASGGDGNDVIGGGDGDDVLAAGFGNDAIGGGAGNDSLSGGGGRDTLSGGTGHDLLSGGTGSDLLSGGAGNDRLSGGKGHDTLAGGDGADTFVFNALAGDDRITDFEQGIDHIQINTPGLAFAALDLLQTPDGALIDLPEGGSILIVGIAPGALTVDDFFFV